MSLVCIHGERMWFHISASVGPTKHPIQCSCCGILLGIREKEPNGEELCAPCSHVPQALGIDTSDRQLTKEGL